MKSLNEFINENTKTWKDLPSDSKNWTYDQATSDDWANARAEFKKRKPVRWSMKKYKEWISQQNKEDFYHIAKTIDPKLIRWVKQNAIVNDETPLQRIQWDIEMYN